MSRLIDLTGRRFGRLVVIERAAVESVKPRWRCQCDCGRRTIIRGSDISLGKSRSCGCAVTESIVARSTKHGYARRGRNRSAEARVWNNMKARCHNPNNTGFKKWYGSRGIVVCQRWRESFEAFLADMGPRPRGTTLDRIDNDGPYSPENCRWATLDQQSNNKRTSVLYECHGERLTAAQLAAKYGFLYITLYQRLKRLTPEEAVKR